MAFNATCPVHSQEQNWTLVVFSVTKQRKQVMFPSLLYEPLALSSNLRPSSLDLELEKDKQSYMIIRCTNSTDLGWQYATYHFKRKPPRYLAAERQEIPAKLLLCTQRSCSKYFH